MGRQNRVLPVDSFFLWRGPSGIGSFLTGHFLPTFALETISDSNLLEFTTTLFPLQSPGLISLPLNNDFVD